MRHTKAHTRNRRSHHAISEQAITTDEKGVPHLRHRVNPTTGEYRGRKVVNVDAKLAKKASKTATEGEEK